MLLIPYERLIYKTNHPPEEVREILNSVVEKPKFIGNHWFITKKLFSGEIHNNDFKLMRISQQVNTFKSVIIGKINQGYVEVKIRTNYVGLFILILLTAVMAYFYFLMYLNKSTTSFVIIASLLNVIMYLICLFSYRYDANQAKKILKDLFDEKA